MINIKKKHSVKHKPSSHRIRKPNKSSVIDLRKKIQRLNEWKRKLSILLRYSKKASITTNLDDLLELLIEEAKVVLAAERATVFLVDKKNKELWSKVATGTKTIRIPLEKGIAGAVALAGQPLNIADVYKDHRFNPEIDKQTGYRTRSVLAVPMFNAKSEVIGVFQVLNRLHGRSFDHQDEEILTLLADQASGDVENAQLYVQVRKSAQETMMRLAAAVEYKDHDTRHHLHRMSEYAAIIARKMDFPGDWVEKLRLAAPMHDIGKIGVPDAILNKPGKLTPEEWDEMKKHPEYGAEILKDSENELLQTSALIALCHHERWDGHGYPRGLEGEAIPIEARIVALADVFDALTSKRIYKRSFSIDETLNIIREESGRHFDPKVVAAFLESLSEVNKILDKYTPKSEESDSLSSKPLT